MEQFDFTAPAEIFAVSRKGPKGPKRQGLFYRKFPTAAEALRHAMEELDADTLKGSVIETDDCRVSAGEIETLYRSDDYPLERGKQS